MRRLTLCLSVVAATVAATTAVAAPAYADVLAQAGVSAGKLTFNDRPGAYDLNLYLNTLGNAIILDAQYTISPLAGCSYPSPSDTTRVSCAGPITGLYVHGGDGNDLIYNGLTGVYATMGGVLYGEAGNDQLYVGNGGSVMIGGPGNDELHGGPLGDDMFPGEGADKVYGGGGSDMVEYEDHTVGVHASLDGVIGDDGAPGEGDTLGADLEHVIGTTFNDVIIGNAAANRLYGNGGADQIQGMDGNDRITDNDGYDGRPLAADVFDGGAGDDIVVYGPGRPSVIVSLDGVYGNDGAVGEGDTILNTETVDGTDGNDIMVGNDGPNTFYGEGGADYLYGMGGDDSLLGGAGGDHLDGGDGTDTCDLGGDGVAMTNCEP